MNELIKKLAEQVYVTGDPWKNKGEPEYMWYNFREDALEKFAKLIIQECINQVDKSNYNSGDEWDTAMARAANNIKEHFGVE